MKKTGTKIFTLALAMILVSSLSSSVIYAKGDDNDDDRYRGREVVIFDCQQALVLVNLSPISFLSKFFVVASDSSSGAPIIDPSVFPAGALPILTPCAQTFADLLNAKFRVEDLTMTGATSRYTMIKK